MLPEGFLNDLFSFLKEGEVSQEALGREKRRLCKKHGVAKVPSNIEVLTSLDGERFATAKKLLARRLVTKPVRSGSGVCVVALMTRPSNCPHGRCTYCPGGLRSPFGDVPQSYTGREPAAMRGARAGYDAYLQVFTRLEQYVVSGHAPEKIELIVMGGTFPAEPWDYQESFIRDAFQALNDFSTLFYNGGELLIQPFKEFFSLPGSVHDEERVATITRRILSLRARRQPSLAEAQRENERAACRCVGLTVETRPSEGKREVGERLLTLGCTRVELGVQTLVDDVLERVHRGHTVADTRESIADLRDLGFKLNFHVMLGLPGMSRERDLAVINQLFTDEAFKPDMIKLYPCLVLDGTPLHQEFLAGRFTPLSTREAASLITDAMLLVPRWCRVMRVQRDIPSTIISGGAATTNLRQLVEEELQARGERLREIRSREIRARPVKRAVLNVIAYQASRGEEFFISFDDPGQDALIGFCRLRFPPRSLRSEFTPRAAVIRELHVYGRAASIGAARGEGTAQHKGFGERLVRVAERIAREHGKERLLVIAGVGVRAYYERLGYRRAGPYMARDL